MADADQLAEILLYEGNSHFVLNSDLTVCTTTNAIRYYDFVLKS